MKQGGSIFVLKKEAKPGSRGARTKHYLFLMEKQFQGITYTLDERSRFAVSSSSPSQSAASSRRACRPSTRVPGIAAFAPRHGGRAAPPALPSQGV